jgi:hypothetical protein
MTDEQKELLDIAFRLSNGRRLLLNYLGINIYQMMDKDTEERYIGYEYKGLRSKVYYDDFDGKNIVKEMLDDDMELNLKKFIVENI